MKIFRFFSIVILFTITVILVISNIFYNDLRKHFNPSYINIELSDELLNDLEKSKKGNADFFLHIKTDKKVYNKYEKILVIARIKRKENNEIVNNAKIEARIYTRDGEKIYNIDESEKVLLTYDEKNKVWKGYFFPKSISEGEAAVEVKAYPDSPEEPVVVNTAIFFDIKKPLPVRKNLALMGISSIERISKRIIISLNGKEVDWNYIPEWIDILSSDGILMNVGITPSFQDDINVAYPWNREKINEADILAEKLNQRGKIFAGYIKAYKVEGAYVEKIGYNTSLVLGQNGVEDSGGISFADENRKNSIQRLFSSMMQNKNYTYVGFSDFISAPNEGLELCEIFMKELQFPLPDNWNDLDFTNKVKVFSEKLKNKDFFDIFERWKKYYTSGLIREIIEKSGKIKPVFYYIDYDTLKKDPELLNLLSSAGIDFFVVNFNIPYFDLIKEIKKSFLDAYSDRLVFSYEIDYKKNLELASSRSLSGIDFYGNAFLTAIKEISYKDNIKGIVINDLYNAISGKRGPFSPLEWMFGIGNIFYEFKKITSDISLKINYILPAEIENNKDFYIQFVFKNLSDKTIKNVKLDIIDYDGNFIKRETLIPELKPLQTKEISLPLSINMKTEKMLKTSEIIGLKFNWEEKSDAEGSSFKGFIISENLNIKNN